MVFYLFTFCPVFSSACRRPKHAAGVQARPKAPRQRWAEGGRVFYRQEAVDSVRFERNEKGEKIAVIETETLELKQSQLFKLKIQAAEYAEKGESLFAEMIEKISVDIEKAREKLNSLYNLEEVV